MHFGFTDTIFLHSGHQHFSATRVAIFREVIQGMQKLNMVQLLT